MNATIVTIASSPPASVPTTRCTAFWTDEPASGWLDEIDREHGPVAMWRVQRLHDERREEHRDDGSRRSARA